jgi:putative colanic acid biosynthesis acetyltransferase WcaF
MKVFLVGPHPPPVHGVAVVNDAVRARLGARGQDCCIVDLSAPSLARGWRNRLSRGPRVLRGLWRVLTSSQAGDCLYLSLSGGAGQAYDLAFAAVGRVVGMRCFVHHHSFAYVTRASALTRLFVAIAGTRAVHVCLSPLMAERLRKGYGGVREIRTVSNVAWLPEGGCVTPRRKHALASIGFLGNIAAEKGVLDFLDVAARLEGSRAPVSCLLAGPFQDEIAERVVRERLRRLPLCEYHGAVSGGHKSAFFERIDVLLFPTRYRNEAEPLTVHEALMHGVPVIAFGRGAIKEMLADSGGLAIEQGADFAGEALRQLQLWRQDADALAGASVAARARSTAMRASASRAAEALLDELCAKSSDALQDLSRFRLPPAFRGRPAWFVQCWWLTQATLFRCSPQFLYRWRRWLLRRFGASIGEGVRVRPSARVTYPWKVSIGDHSWIGDDVVLYSLGAITIGSNCVVSQRCYLCAGTHDYRNAAFEIHARPIDIEDQAWLAADVFVSPGSRVGRGTVVGARSGVFADLPPETVCFGTPARPVSSRRAASGAPAVALRRHERRRAPRPAQ